MAYAVDTGSQKYYEPGVGLVEARPAVTLFDSQASSYSVDTGSQKYYNAAVGLIETQPIAYLFAVVSAVTFIYQQLSQVAQPYKDRIGVVGY